MASNLSKGYQDIGESTTRTTTRPGKPTPTGRPRQQVVHTPTREVPAKSPPSKKPAPKPKYERMEEKDTASHRISESRTEIKDQYEKFKAQLDQADRDYFNARKRVDLYGKLGMVRTDEELQYAEDLKRWQEENKVRFKSWVDSVVERNRENTKAPGTFNNMLEDAEEAFAELDSRKPPEQYRADRIASGRAARIEKAKLLPAEPVDENENVVQTLGGLFGPESQTGQPSLGGTAPPTGSLGQSASPIKEAGTPGAIIGGGGANPLASLVGPDGKPLFTEKMIRESADKSNWDRSPTQVKGMFYSYVDNQAKKKGWSKEQVYKMKQVLDERMELLSIEEQMATQRRKLEAAQGGGMSLVGKFFKGARDIGVELGGRGLDIASRPLYAVAQGVEQLAKSGEVDFGDIADIGSAAWHGFSGQSKRTFADVIRDAYVGGGNDLDTWWENALISGAGLTADIVGDPVSWLTLGSTTAGKQVAVQTARKIGNKRVVDALLKEVYPTVRRGRRVLEEGEIATKTAKFEAEVAKIPSVIKAAETLRANEVTRLTKQGISVSGEANKQIFEEALAKVVKPDGASFETALRSGNKPRVAVKFAGKDIGDIRPVGYALERAHVPATAINKAYKNTQFGRTMASMFNMKAHFPALTDRLRRVTEGHGLVAHQEFQKKVDDALKGLNKEDRELLATAKQTGQDLTGVRSTKTPKIDMGDVQKVVYKYSDDMWDEKVLYELNDPGHKDPNFVFHQYRGSSKAGPKEIKRFKLDRKSRIRRGAQSPTLQDAIDEGMRPFTDYGDILKHQHADHQRKFSKVYTKTAIADQYGLLTNSPMVAKANGLVDVTMDLPKNLQNIATKQGQRWYLHQDIADTFRNLDKFHSLGVDEELKNYMKMITRFTNWWKSTATIYNPGNWVNNSLGDLVLNYFDGVQNPIWYKRAFPVVMMGQRSDKKIIMRLGKHNLTQKEAWELYERFGGSAGFLRADVDEVVGRVAPRTRHKIHAAYQAREDMSRFAHFMYALQDEFKRVGPKVQSSTLYQIPGGALTASSKPGTVTSMTRRIEAAAAAASDRVAKFNIDYSAFTPFERKLKGGAVPFYSWMRKAFPLMLENMIQRPGRYSALNKMQVALERGMGVEPEYEGYYNVHYPQWLQEAGFRRVKGGAFPKVWKNTLPTNIFGDVFGGGSPQGMIRNTLSNLHPGIQAPIELAFNKQLYSGADVGDFEDYLTSKFPVTGVIGAITGVEFPGQPEWTAGRRWGKLTGQTMYDVGPNMQAGELRRQQDALDARLRQLNQEIYPIVVEKSSKGYTIVNAENGRKFEKTFADPKDAYTVALELKKQDRSPPGSGG